jgi:hypothetical protein
LSIDLRPIFLSFWNVRIQVFIKLYSPFAKKIPLPFFQRRNLIREDPFPLPVNLGFKEIWLGAFAAMRAL